MGDTVNEPAVLATEVEMVSVGSLELHPDNPRQGDVGAVVESVRANGFASALVAQKSSRRVLAGNHRLLAARELGLGEVPVLWVDVDDERALRIMLADNRSSDLASYDDRALADLLGELASSDGGLTGVGWDGDDLDALLRSLDDPVPDRWRDRPFQGGPVDDPVSSLGDVWVCGDHVVGCGDATDPGFAGRLVGDRRVRLVVTDPPYGIDYSGGAGVERERLESDSPGSVGEHREWLAGFVGVWSGLCEPGAAWYVCSPGGPMLRAFVDALGDADLFRWSLVWVKDRATFGRADYQQRSEYVLYGWVPGGAHYRVKDRTQTTVWEFPRPADSDSHPTEKPVALVERAIRNSSDEGWLVADPFLGSGTALVACELSGRPGVFCEVSPGFVDVAVGRWQSMTGRRAVHAVTGVEFPGTPTP